MQKVHSNKQVSIQSSLPRRARHASHDTSYDDQSEAENQKQTQDNHEHCESDSSLHELLVIPDENPGLDGNATLEDWDQEGTDADCVDDDSVDDEEDSLTDGSADKPQEYLEVYSNPARIEHFPDSFEADKDFQIFEFEERSPNVNHVYPFLGSRDYKLPRFFIESRVPKRRIDQFFKDEILPPASATERQHISFKSGHTSH